MDAEIAKVGTKQAAQLPPAVNNELKMWELVNNLNAIKYLSPDLNPSKNRMSLHLDGMSYWYDREDRFKKIMISRAAVDLFMKDPTGAKSPADLKQQAIDIVNAREVACKEEYGVSLHELARQCATKRQDLFLTHEEREKYRSEVSATLSKNLRYWQTPEGADSLSQDNVNPKKFVKFAEKFSAQVITAYDKCAEDSGPREAEVMPNDVKKFLESSRNASLGSVTPTNAILPEATKSASVATQTVKVADIYELQSVLGDKACKKGEVTYSELARGVTIALNKWNDEQKLNSLHAILNPLSKEQIDELDREFRKENKEIGLYDILSRNISDNKDCESIQGKINGFNAMNSKESLDETVHNPEFNANWGSDPLVDKAYRTVVGLSEEQLAQVTSDSVREKVRNQKKNNDTFETGNLVRLDKCLAKMPPASSATSTFVINSDGSSTERP